MTRKKLRAAQTGLLILSGGLVVLGAYSGEIQMVLIKATRICLECIGLG